MELTIKTNKREEVIDITEQIKTAVSELWEKDKKLICNKKSRVCLVYTSHTTCSVIINEIKDDNICQDVLLALKKLIPQDGWKHRCPEGENGDSHIKATIVGSEKLIPLANGKLMLGTYQSIGLAEFDGPRERKVIIQII